MSTTTSTMASVFPFGLSAERSNLSPSTANAIDSHLMEIASLRDATPGDSQGTVLAVVTFPKDKPARACDDKIWEDVWLRMSYEKLTGLESKKIQQMFSPRAQARFRRRHGFEQQLPPGIDYILDFTPPSEGPELADLTAALWLPRVVKLWFLAGQYLPDPVLEQGLGLTSRPLADKAVGAILALGHDDICKGLGCLTDYAEWQTKEDLPGIVEESPDVKGHIPPWRKVEDYCPIRHRVAIVRVLKAINGGGLLLNSAVRLWTVAQVAISLDVPQVVVDPVTQWLVAPPNTKFIEICPEKAFQLAYALKIPSVLIAAFRILVNELAIDYASSNPVPTRPQLTWAQRRREDYGDYPSDPVEYAARAFAERISGKLKLLQSDDVFDRLPLAIPEWDKLQHYGTLIAALPPGGPLQKAHEALTAALRSAFRRWINRALHPASFSPRLSQRLVPLLEAQRSHYIPSTTRQHVLNLYSHLNPAQKALTPFFWDQLGWPEPCVDFCDALNQTTPCCAEAFNRALERAADDNPVLAASLHAAFWGGPLDTNTTTTNTTLGTPRVRFDPVTFHAQLCAAIRAFCTTVAPAAARPDAAESGIPFFLSDHLLLLGLDEATELAYLPIWADGLDDGSGGVFQEAVPAAEMGPSEPGPGYHTGFTTAGTGAGTETEGGGGGGGGAATTAGSVSDLGVGVLSLGSTVTSGSGMRTKTTTGTAGRSLQVQESGASSSSVSGAPTPSEGFTADGEEEGGYADARFAQPAGHQAQGVAIERYVDEAEEGAGCDSDEEMDFGSDDGSSTLDGFEEIDEEEAR